MLIGSGARRTTTHVPLPHLIPLQQDLRELLKHVKESSVLVLFQSRNVLERPWCLLELYTAVMEGVPIVALNCAGKGYDFGKAADLLLHLETNLAKLNPSAIQVLKSTAWTRCTRRTCSRRPSPTSFRST